MQRRQFLQLAAATTLATTGKLGLNHSTALAVEPFNRKGPPRFQIGLAAYSLRNYFSWNKGKPRTPHDDGPAIDMFGFIDYCVQLRIDAAELTSYFFPPDADHDYFLKVKRAAFLRGVDICGTAIGNNFTVAKQSELDAEIDRALQWIDYAAVMGAPHIRFFAGTGRQLAEDASRLDQAAEAIQTCAKHAATKGIFLGVENHGRLTAQQMLQIMQRIDSPWVGINLDTGNFISDDPYRDLELCAPYAVNVQVKASIKSPDGHETPTDLNRIASILRSANYQGYVVLEYEDANPYQQIPSMVESLRTALRA